MNARHGIRAAGLLSLGGLVFLAACGSSSPAEVSVSITGSALPMLITTQREFTGAVHGTSDDSVVWSLPEGVAAGTITSSGRYTAGTTPGTYHVVLTSHADPTASDTVQVTVLGLGSPTGLGYAAYGAAINHNGRIAIANNATQVRFLGGVAPDSVVVNGTPVHVIFNAAGDLAWTTLQSDNTLVKLQTSPAQEMTRLAFGHSLYNLTIDSPNARLYVTTADGWLFQVNPVTLAKMDSLHLASASNGLAFNKDNSRLYVSTIAAGILYAIDMTTFTKADSFDVGSGAQRVAVAPSGDSVYVANENSGAVVVVRPSTHTVTSVPIAGTPYGLALSADGAALYVSLRTAGTVRLLRRPQLDSLGTITVGGTPRNVAVAPSGDFVVVTTESDVVKIQ